MGTNCSPQIITPFIETYLTIGFLVSFIFFAARGDGCRRGQKVEDLIIFGIFMLAWPVVLLGWFLGTVEERLSNRNV